MEQIIPQPPNSNHSEFIETREDPMVVIRMIMQHVAAMGRNDHEMSSLLEITRRYKSTDPKEKYSAQEAIDAARAIMEHKQDYN